MDNQACSTPRPITVCSFWVHRPKEFPRETKAYDYGKMLQALDKCCKRYGYDHIVLTDWATSDMVSALDLKSYGVFLERNLMQAVTEVQAAFMESPFAEGHDILFVGADCLIRRDIRDLLPPGDFLIAFMKGHKAWRLNTGFVYVRAEARERATKLLRQIARDVKPKICDDMAAYERALSPMPRDYGMVKRCDMNVHFVPLELWNHPPLSPYEEAEHAHILHFYGDRSKVHFFPWAERFLPKDEPEIKVIASSFGGGVQVVHK